MTEMCQRCLETDEDRRTLRMACGYEMSELKIPLTKEERESPMHCETFYTLRICKACRADWMQAIKSWFDNPVKRESCGSGIYIRHYGDNIEITEEEWNKIQPGCTPVRFIKE